MHDDSRTATEARAEIVAEAGGWSVFFPGLPLAVDAGSFDEAVDEMIRVLREYASDWRERLSKLPDHCGNRGLVQLIELSDDAWPRHWLISDGH